MYGTETRATTKNQERKLELNEMRMLRWMCGDKKIKNDTVMRNKCTEADLENVVPLWIRCIFARSQQALKVTINYPLGRSRRVK